MKGLARFALLAALGAGSIAATQPPTAQTTTGTVRGTIENGVATYRGIPFAAPPVGELRWQAPQPAKPWSGERDASRFGSDCMQLPFPQDAAPIRTTPSEDCLYINVWTPAERKAERLPVLVWIYGGGFVTGGGSPATYDGSAFARDGVIFVSFNYRIGRFGFFAHPALTAAREGPVGNYGLMDQIAALKWVEANIEKFGGDPDKVTISGESAGGGSVLSLLTSPAAAGLADGGIVMSGGGRSLMRATRMLDRDVPGLPSAESVGLDFARSVGIEGTGPDALTALRALPTDKVAKGVSFGALFAGGIKNFAGGPFIDGTIMTEPQDAVFAAGRQAKVPLMVGYTSADIGFIAAADKNALFARFGDDGTRARQLYDPAGNTPLPAVMAAVGRDQTMGEPARHIAALNRNTGQPAWFYRFSYVAESARAQSPGGAAHASEIPFFFNTVAAKYGDALTPQDAAAAKAVQSYVANFARTLDPNGRGLPAWPVYDPATRPVMDFGADGAPRGGADPLRPQLDLVEQLSSRAP